MGDNTKVADFQNILHSTSSSFSPNAGRLKMADQGLAFREGVSGTIISVESHEMKKLTFLRAARDYELRILTVSGVTHKFDGFALDVRALGALGALGCRYSRLSSMGSPEIPSETRQTHTQ